VILPRWNPPEGAFGSRGPTFLAGAGCEEKPRGARGARPRGPRSGPPATLPRAPGKARRPPGQDPAPGTTPSVRSRASPWSAPRFGRRGRGTAFGRPNPRPRSGTWRQPWTRQRGSA
jgi:hypothetical protein